MNNQSNNQQGVSMTIKCLMVTGGNEDPRRHGGYYDDWWSCEDLEAGRDYTLEELVAIAKCDDSDALWIYEGEDWLDKQVTDATFVNGSVRYVDKFYPWDRMENLTLVREATKGDDYDDEFNAYWNREIAMEAGMLGGADAYNEAMGY